MKQLSDIEILDYKKNYLETPEEGFSPERNKAIVEKTITDYELMLKNKVKTKVEHYAERADAVVSYLKHLTMGHEGSVEKYFGRRELARLRGDQIRDELIGKLNIIRTRKGL